MICLESLLRLETMEIEPIKYDFAAFYELKRLNFMFVYNL